MEAFKKIVVSVKKDASWFIKMVVWGRKNEWSYLPSWTMVRRYGLRIVQKYFILILWKTQLHEGHMSYINITMNNSQFISVHTTCFSYSVHHIFFLDQFPKFRMRQSTKFADFAWRIYIPFINGVIMSEFFIWPLWCNNILPLLVSCETLKNI